MMLKQTTMTSFATYLWLIIGFLIIHTSAAAMNESQVNVSSTPAPATLKDFEKQADELIGYITKMILPIFVQNADARISSHCTKSIIRIFNDVKKMKFVAIKLLDSMGKPVSGMMEGSFSMMGDYEECLSISVSKKKHPTQNPEDELFHGQYCTLSARLPPAMTAAIEDFDNGLVNASQLGKLRDIIENIPLKSFAREFFEYNFGACVPSTCSVEDLKVLIALAPIPFPIEVKRCETKTPPPITYDQIAIITLLGILALLVTTGTSLDAFFHLKDPTYKEQHKGKHIDFLMSFSVYSNTKKFMRSQKDASTEVSCINGMYVTGTFLVIVYHTYFVPFLHYVYHHTSHIDDYFRDFSFTLISTMAISIESYFLFSGFFLVYARWSWAAGGKVKINIPRLIFRRYLRLTPSMLFIMGLILLLPVFGNGPLWEDVFGLAATNTRKYWWHYVLMINNFQLPKDQSFLYLWFIPCLMQLTIVGIVLSWILARNTKLGIAVIVLVSVACNAVLGIITYQNNYPPSFAIYFLKGREKYEVPIYTAPLAHMTSFGIGMILGHYMSRNKVISWKPATVVIGWIVCIAFTVGIQLALYICHDGKLPNPIFSVVYGATHKTIFALGMVWVILACTHGYGGVMGKLLCWKGFGPMSKLGYCGYLVHYLVIAYHISVARRPMMYSHFEIWIRIAGYNFLTFAFAYVMYITFEMPLQYLESQFFGRSHKSNVTVPIINGINGINGTDKIIKGNNNDVIVSSITVDPVWMNHKNIKDVRPENSRL